MLPLRTLLVPYESLSLPERARALLLAREAGAFAARLLGPGADRASGVRVWQRLIIEEALLRGIVPTDEAFALMRRTVAEEPADPRLEAFLVAWTDTRDEQRARQPVPHRRLELVRGGRSGVSRVRAERAGNAAALPIGEGTADGS